MGQMQVVVGGDMAEGVGADVRMAMAVAIILGIGRAADAEAVEDAQNRAGHQFVSTGSTRSAMSGRLGAASPR